MPIDRTLDFKTYVAKSTSATPPLPKAKRLARRDANEWHVAEKAYMSEAHTILNHVTNLTRMLSNIRRPYLNLDSSTSLTRLVPRTIDLGTAQVDDTWAGIRYLTNEERDQIDLQARVILSRCADRVKEMEALEKERARLASSKQTSTLFRLLPSRLTNQNPEALSSTSDFLAAHNASVTWYLNRRLAEASQGQKEMQEERIKRQLERSRTLGSVASNMPTFEPVASGSGNSSFSASSWLGSDVIRSKLGSSSTAPPPPPPPISLSDDEDDDEELDLTASQIQQFESENAQILSNVHSVLQSVQLAESRLLDIAALQMDLVAHLTKQSEVTEQLYDDAVGAASMVESGNEQLRDAKRRAGDSRMWFLIFLIGASLALLFLHVY